MTEDTVTMVGTHSVIKVRTTDGDRKPACTCQLNQLDGNEIVDGRVPVDIPPLAENCPHRKGYTPPVRS